MRVLILGAGASKAESQQMPLMREFFQQGAITEAFFDADGWRTAREELFAAGVTNVHLRDGTIDLEQALTAIRERQPEVRDSRPRRLEHYVLMTLRVLSADAIQREVPVHSRLVEWLRRGCVISLNYDVLMDHALELAGLWHPGDGYGIQFAGQTRFNDVVDPVPANKDSELLLLKLHGSLSWLRASSRSTCTGDLPGGGMISEMVPADDLFFTRSPYHPFQPYEEDEGASLGPLEDHFLVFPYIVPPGRGKTAKALPHFQEVWRAALDCLRAATEVLIVGCSLRKDDTDLIKLLREGLSRPGRKPVLVNVIDVSEGVAEHIERLFRDVATVKYRGGDILGYLERD